MWSLSDIYNKLFPINTSEWNANTSNDPTVQARLNNERIATAGGAYSAGGFQKPSAGQVLGYATTGSMPTYGPTATQQQLDSLRSGGGGGGGGTGDIPQPQQPTGGGPDFAALLRQAKENGMRDLANARDSALRYGQEARGLLQKKRGEFTDMFNQGRDTILDTHEQNRGEAQAADMGSEQKAKGTLAAMGLGGSALERLMGKQMQARTKAQGELSTMRNTNETANTNQYNTRNDWADAQDSAIGESERQANERYQQGVGTSDVNFGNALGGLLSQVQAQQAALQAANQNVAGYSASPYAVTGMNPAALISSLQGQLGGMGLMGGNTGVDNSGISISQNPQNDEYKRLMGLR